MGIFDFIEDVVDGVGTITDGIVEICTDNVFSKDSKSVKDESRLTSKSNNPTSSKSHGQAVNKMEEEESCARQRRKSAQDSTPAKCFLRRLMQLRSEENRAIDEINKNGDNLLANVTDSLFSSPKSTKMWRLAKTISGKTKSEKLLETRVAFDEKKALLIDQTMTPSLPEEIWDMLMVTKDLYGQKSLGKCEKEACKNLLERLIENALIAFRNDSDKISVIDDIRVKFANEFNC